MLSLIPELHPELSEFCQKENIRDIHLQVAKVKDNVPLSYSKAVQAVQVCILNIIVSNNFILLTLTIITSFIYIHLILSIFIF